MFNTFRPFVRLRPVFISKIIAPNRGSLGLGRTNSESADEPLMGGSFFCGERGGDRSIGEANLRKGRQPLQWKRPCRPLLWKRPCRPLQWKRPCRPLQWKRCCRPLQWKWRCRPLQWKWRCRPLQWNRHSRLARLAPICVLMSCIMVCWRIRIYSKLYLPAWRPPVRREKL